MRKKATISFVVAGILGLFLSYLSIAYGSVNIPGETIWRALREGVHSESKDVAHTIIWTLRMPRLMMAVLVGLALSIAGAALQGLFQNPLADPYVLGISAGGCLGAVLSLFIQLGGGAMVVAPAVGAFVGSAVTALVIYRLALTPLGLSLNGVLLAGIAVGLVCSAFLSLLLLSKPDYTADILSWLMGQLGGTTWQEVGVVFICTIIGLVMIAANHLTLDAMLLGEDAARSLGVNLAKRKIIILSACALLTAGAVAYSGLIGFVGLMVPHIARLIVGAQNRFLLPLSALCGAVLLVGADLGARTLFSSGEIPVGVITGCCGGLFFLVLLRRGLNHD